MIKHLHEIKDQDDVLVHLKNSLRDKRFNHAYAFIGKKGIGKKAVALSFAKAILCNGGGADFCDNCSSCKKIESDNYVEFIPLYDEGDKIKIDNIRKILEEVSYTKVEGTYRIVFIENGERMTKESANALLKTLEEPPEHTIFIMTISEVDKILPTILSRMEKYYFHPLSEGTVKEILEDIGYEDRDLMYLGSIDEMKILLGEENILSFADFIEVMKGKDLYRGFMLAEELSKKDYLKTLLSYYEQCSRKRLIETAGVEEKEKEAHFYMVIIEEMEVALRKIGRNVNSKHSLEYSFLRIMERMDEKSE